MLEFVELSEAKKCFKAKFLSLSEVSNLEYIELLHRFLGNHLIQFTLFMQKCWLFLIIFANHLDFQLLGEVESFYL
jgi:hypothetical protein